MGTSRLRGARRPVRLKHRQPNELLLWRLPATCTASMLPRNVTASTHAEDAARRERGALRAVGGHGVAQLQREGALEEGAAVAVCGLQAGVRHGDLLVAVVEPNVEALDAARPAARCSPWVARRCAPQ